VDGSLKKRDRMKKHENTTPCGANQEREPEALAANPWLAIPAADYDGHMSSPGVGQQAFIADTFRAALSTHDSTAVALLGCATGNGLEHVNPRRTSRITAVDFNPDYLEILRRRFEGNLPGMEILRADLTTCSLAQGAYTLVFAGLVFEYLEPAPLLERVAAWLCPGGVLETILQLPVGEAGQVSASPYTSLQQLNRIMNLVDPSHFDMLAHEAGLQAMGGRTETLPSGKSFFIGSYSRA
jgi:phospholipid N-methyltransferase